MFTVMQAVPGAAPRCVLAACGARKVIATNGTTYPRRNKFENSKIAKYFAGFLSAEDLGVAKSDPVFFLRVLQHYGVPKEDALVVGDDYHLDILGALDAGIDCCWFNYRQKEVGLRVPDTVAVIRRFPELVGVVTGGVYEEKHWL